MSATKNEKQLMDEKVAKVREVVHNVSRNDIVLALHNFDMDVERTINAFCSGGAESALGDWEKTSTAGKKKQQKKKKTPEASTVSSVSSANNISPSKPVSVVRAAPPPASAPSTASQSSLNGSINGYSTTTAVAVPKPQQNGVAKPTKTAPLKNGTSHAPSPKKAQEPTRSTTKSSNAAVTASGTAETTISHYFQELRRALDDRERQLLSEVAHDGSESRFVADASKLLQAIARFGEVESAKPNAFSPQQNQATIDIIKHSNSHSSLVSSVGEDSGLGQTSPVSREKSTTQVVSSGGGIVMQSDALSEEQLADLQRRIEETLKAQGIDPSVLSEIGSGAAPRRRPPQKKPPRKDQRADKGRHQPQVELSILQ